MVIPFDSLYLLWISVIIRDETRNTRLSPFIDMRITALNTNHHYLVLKLMSIVYTENRLKVEGETQGNTECTCFSKF